MFETIAINYLGASHIGHLRQENQDVWLAQSERGIFLLADGIGGRQGGKLAAEIAISATATYLSQLAIDLPKSREQAVTWMEEAILQANQAVFERGQAQVETSEMGTTLSVLWVLPDYAVIAHVGDSRVYCLRGESLMLMTEDHKVEMIVNEEVVRTMLSRAVGVTPTVQPSLQVFNHQKHDLFLLCSDGLTSAISDQAICAILNEKIPLDMKASLLIQGALNHGGKDNITVLLVEL